MMLAVIARRPTDDIGFFDRDIWRFDEIAVSVSETKSSYRLNFSNITQFWLKVLAKKYIRLMALTRSFGVLQNYVTAITALSNSLAKHGATGTEVDITRDLAILYMADLKKANLAPDTRKKRILSVKLFLEIAHREGWVTLNNPTIFYSEDTPKVPKTLPRFIPEAVMHQLNRNIERLEPTIMRLIIIIQECGMRISEIAMLTKNCSIQDSDGDYFLRTYQSKMQKEHSIPITSEIFNVIVEQVDYVDQVFGKSCQWLFPVEPKTRVGRKNIRAGSPYKTKTIIDNLNWLAKSANITGNDGKPYHFTTHMFRHTVGTRMINNGVPQHIVQRYLGHESPTMTSTYAHIMDSTMKREFAKFKGLMVDIAGNVFDSDTIATDISRGADNVDSQWLKRHISAQALPNGLCAMPVVQSCDKANACLTCGNFRTDTRYLAHHKEQLERTCSILDTAKQNGWTRQIEMNECLRQNLINIIEPLEAQNDA